MKKVYLSLKMRITVQQVYKFYIIFQNYKELENHKINFYINYYLFKTFALTYAYTF